MHARKGEREKNVDSLYVFETTYKLNQASTRII